MDNARTQAEDGGGTVAGSDAFQRQLAAIAEDRVHGAGFLAQRAIWALAQAATTEGATAESVREAASPDCAGATARSTNRGSLGPIR